MPKLHPYEEQLDPLGFFQHGHPSRERVLEWFGLSESQAREIWKITPRDGPGLEPQDSLIAQLAYLANAVTMALAADSSKAHQWFLTRNPLLGDVAPLDMIKLGRIYRLETWIENARRDASD